MATGLQQSPANTELIHADGGFTTAFPSELGSMAVCFDGDRLVQLTFDHGSRSSALRSIGAVTSTEDPSPSQRSVVDLLTAYAAGEPVDLSRIEVSLPWTTPFALRVVEACRGIGYGEELSYGEVARIAGSPGAARAVGNIMAKNPIPLVIPCHRVIGSHGALGGYSARGGLAVKERLLAMEQTSVQADAVGH